MNSSNLVNEVFNDFEAGKFDKANNLLSDNFKTTLLGKEVNKPVYISAYRSLLKEFPDLRLDVQSLKSEGMKTTAKLKLSGTNSHTIPALMKGWREIPATHKKIDGLIMDLEIVLKDDKIEEIRNAKNTRGLFISLLDHLGMDYRKLQEN
jgi:predicted ester cyclase